MEAYIVINISCQLFVVYENRLKYIHILQSLIALLEINSTRTIRDSFIYKDVHASII
jgi:hypothetical protein